MNDAAVLQTPATTVICNEEITLAGIANLLVQDPLTQYTDIGLPPHDTMNSPPQVHRNSDQGLSFSTHPCVSRSTFPAFTRAAAWHSAFIRQGYIQVLSSLVM